MDYFKMYFPDDYLFDELNAGLPEGKLKSIASSTDQSHLSYNRNFLQVLFNELFNIFVTQQLNISLSIKEEILLKLNAGLKSEDFPDILGKLILSKYLLNYDSDSKVKDPFQSLFDTKGIINALDKIQQDEECLFLNKYSIIRILDSYFDCVITITLFDLIYSVTYFDKKQKAYVLKKGFVEQTLKNAEEYFNKNPILTFKNKSFNAIEKESQKEMYYRAFHDHYKIMERYFTENSNHGMEYNMQAFQNFKRYKKSIFANMYKYLITNEEFNGKKEMFAHTWKKKILLYELLPYIDIESNLPKIQSEFGKMKDINTKNFNDFKRDKVTSFFGK